MWKLLPIDAVLASPGCDTPVAGVGPAVARFLVAPQPSNTKLAVGPFQYMLHRADAHNKWLTEAGQGCAQLDQAFAAEVPLPAGAIWLPPQIGLHHIKRQHWSPQRRLQQGPVVEAAQIALKPNYLQGPQAVRGIDRAGKLINPSSAKGPSLVTVAR